MNFVQPLNNVVFDLQVNVEQIQKDTGQNMFQTSNPEQLPENTEELSLHMQLSYKQSIEIAEEEAIANVLANNKYHETKKRLLYDLVVLGIACAKTNYNNSNGITVDYVDPANLVYSYTEDPNFEDIYYVGEVKSVSIAVLAKQFPHLTVEEMDKIQKFPGTQNYLRNWNEDPDIIQLLYFEYKTYSDQVFKIKETASGLEKALEKQDTFIDAPEGDNFKKAFRSIEVLYSGAKILGHEKMLRWQMAENMTRPYADTVKVNMNYNIVAPRLYKGRIESIVSRITGFADMIQLTHLKLQQVMSRIVPDLSLIHI